MAATIVARLNEKELKGKKLSLIDVAILSEVEIERRKILHDDATIQETLRFFFDLNLTQQLFTVVIVAYFGVTCMKSQYRHNMSETEDNIFWYLEMIFTGIFAFELMWNFLAYFPNVPRHGWDVFDFVLVLTSIVVVYGGLEYCDFILAGRSLKIFQKYENTISVGSLRMAFIYSMKASVALVLMLFLGIILLCIAGTKWFGHDPEYGNSHFGNFSRSFMTSMEVLTADGSFTAIREVMDSNRHYAAMWALFFNIMVTIVGMNLFAAVFLDAFFNGKTEAERMYKKFKMRTMFESIDEDGSGVLERDELEAFANILARIDMQFDPDMLLKNKKKDIYGNEQGATFDEFFEVYHGITDKSLAIHSSKVELWGEKVDGLTKMLKETKIETRVEHKLLGRIQENIGLLHEMLQQEITYGEGLFTLEKELKKVEESEE